MIACVDVNGHKFTNKRKNGFSQHLTGLYNIMLGKTFITNISATNYKCGCVRVNYSNSFDTTMSLNSLLLVNNDSY